jgi:hypothetical protein
MMAALLPWRPRSEVKRTARLAPSSSEKKVKKEKNGSLYGP